MNVSTLTRVEPFRTIFILYKYGSVLLKLPVWVAFYVRRINRPRTSWSLTKAVMMNVIRGLIDMSYRTGRFRGRDVTKEVEAKHCQDARFIWLEPVSPNIIVGQLKQFAESCGVDGIRVPAYGFGEWQLGSNIDCLARDGEKIVLHLHGGGFVVGTAHPEDATANVSRGLIKWRDGVISRTLSVDYRLSSSTPFPTSAPFPSALIDALAGYVYLVEKLGFKPRNIIVAGDSAGGNIALGLVRYLRDSPQTGLGMPGGLLLFSPWCDPVGTHIGPAAEKSRSNIGVDYLKPWSDSPRASGSYAVKSYLGDMPREVGAKNPYIGPASLELDPAMIEGMFTGFPPTYILSGDAELLVDEIRTLGQRMTADLPEGQVVFNEVPDAVHDFVAFPFWEPERSSAFQRIISWIQKL